MMALADLLKQRSGSPGSLTENAEGTAVAPATSGGSLSSPGSLEIINEVERIYPTTAIEWVTVIQEQCPLLIEDMHYVRKRLGRMEPGVMEQAASRYIQVWHAAAAAELKPHRKDNAGRRAANQTLLKRNPKCL